MKARVALVLVPLFACGSPAGTTTGLVGGEPFTVGDAITAYLQDNQLTLFVTSASGLCTYLSNGKLPKSSSMLTLVLAERDQNNNIRPITTGEFAVGTGVGGGEDAGQPQSLRSASGLFAKASDSCFNNNPNVLTVSSGTVTVTSLDGGAKGSYTLTFQSGESLTGTFDAMSCGLSTSNLQQFQCF